MIEQLDHVNIVVEDLRGMTAFYRDVLGLRVTKEVVIQGDWIEAVVGLKGVVADVVYLDMEQGARIELLYYRSPEGDRPGALGKANTKGLRHLAFRVGDIDEVVERLKVAGVRVFGGVQTVPDQQVTYAGGVRKRLVYFQDPEGNLLELCEYR